MRTAERTVAQQFQHLINEANVFFCSINYHRDFLNQIVRRGIAPGGRVAMRMRVSARAVGTVVGTPSSSDGHSSYPSAKAQGCMHDPTPLTPHMHRYSQVFSSCYQRSF